MPDAGQPGSLRSRRSWAPVTRQRHWWLCWLRREQRSQAGGHGQGAGMTRRAAAGWLESGEDPLSRVRSAGHGPQIRSHHLAHHHVLCVSASLCLRSIQPDEG
jgi:hypothetical protein